MGEGVGFTGRRPGGERPPGRPANLHRFTDSLRLKIDFEIGKTLLRAALVARGLRALPRIVSAARRPSLRRETPRRTASCDAATRCSTISGARGSRSSRSSPTAAVIARCLQLRDGLHPAPCSRPCPRIVGSPRSRCRPRSSSRAAPRRRPRAPRARRPRTPHSPPRRIACSGSRSPTSRSCAGSWGATDSRSTPSPTPRAPSNGAGDASARTRSPRSRPARRAARAHPHDPTTRRWGARGVERREIRAPRRRQSGRAARASCSRWRMGTRDS